MLQNHSVPFGQRIARLCLASFDDIEFFCPVFSLPLGRWDSAPHRETVHLSCAMLINSTHLFKKIFIKKILDFVNIMINHRASDEFWLLKDD